MPRYFFYIREGDEFIPDEEGMEFANVDSAWIEAVESIRDLVIQSLRNNRPIAGLMIEIADANGNILGSVSAGDIIKH